MSAPCNHAVLRRIGFLSPPEWKCDTCDLEIEQPRPYEAPPGPSPELLAAKQSLEIAKLALGSYIIDYTRELKLGHARVKQLTDEIAALKAVQRER